MKRRFLFAAFVFGIVTSVGAFLSAQTPPEVDTFEKMLLGELGITDEHIAGLEVVMPPVIERSEQRLLEYMLKQGIVSDAENPELAVDSDIDPVVMMNQVQLVMYENFMQMHDELTEAAQGILSDEQIQTFKERMFQVNFETWGPRYEFLENGVIYTDCTAMNLIFGSLDVLGFTPEQKSQFLDIIKEANEEINRDSYAIETETQDEIQALHDKIANAKNEEEQESFSRQLDELNQEKNRKVDEISQKVSKKINQKLDKILTDEQKAKKQKLFDQMPDYIWRARLENQDKERPWRPNLHSWQPGQGVPEQMDNHPGESRSPKKQDGKKSFPGSE